MQKGTLEMEKVSRDAILGYSINWLITRTPPSSSRCAISKENKTEETQHHMDDPLLSHSLFALKEKRGDVER